ncbi:hypothetical protein H8E07_15090 [bacterium]|nr:hypothetical protein [bacterium]
MTATFTASDLQATPVKKTGPASTHGLPKRLAPPNTPFELMWHPNRWDWSDELGWYMSLGRFWHDPGSGNVDQHGDLTKAVAALRKRGWDIIEIGDRRLDPKYREFCVGYDVAGGGKRHVDMWSRPRLIGNRLYWEKDGAAYWDFVRHCLAKGIIDPIDPAIKAEKIRRQTQVIRKIHQDLEESPGSPVLEGRLRFAEKRLARMRGEDAMTAEATADAAVTAAHKEDATQAELDALREELAALKAQRTAPTPAAPRVTPKKRRGRPPKKKAGAN